MKKIKFITVLFLFICILINLCGCKPEYKIAGVQIDNLLDSKRFIYMFGIADYLSFDYSMEVESDGVKYYKVTDNTFLQWSDWENFVKSVYTDELAEKYLKECKLIDYNGDLYTNDSISNVDLSSEWVYEILENGRNKAVIVQKTSNIYDGNLINTEKITFLYGDNGWRISEVDTGSID